MEMGLYIFNAPDVAHVNNETTSVPLQKVHVESTIVQFVSRTSVYQTYELPANGDSEAVIEAVYKFPLDARSAVCEFEALIDKKHRVVGQVFEKDDAKKKYDAAVVAGKGAYMVEQRTKDIFVMNIGNLRAGQRVDIKLTYVADLPMDADGMIRFVLPTTIAPRYGGNKSSVTAPQVPLPPRDDAVTAFAQASSPLDKESTDSQDASEDDWVVCDEAAPSDEKKIIVVGGEPQYTPYAQYDNPLYGGSVASQYQVSLSIQLVTNEIASISSPSHPLAFSNFKIAKEESSTQIKLGRKSSFMDKDFVLLFGSKSPETPQCFVEQDPATGLWTGMVSIVPHFQAPTSVPAMEIVFVVDRSGSMQDKVEDLRLALELFLRSLPVTAYFNIISFGYRSATLYDRSLPMNRENLEKACQAVLQFNADMGGTEMIEPLQSAFTLPIPANQDAEQIWHRQVIFLTDGQVHNESEVSNLIREHCQAQGHKDAPQLSCRLFSLGLGYSVSRSFIESVARAGRGTSHTVLTGQELTGHVIEILKQAVSPAVESVTVDWGFPSQTAVDTAGQVDESAPNSVPWQTANNQENAVAVVRNVDKTDLCASESVLQVPGTAPPLFAGERGLVFAFFPKTVKEMSQLPKNIKLRHKNSNIDIVVPLVPIENMKQEHISGRILSTIAARAVLCELEEQDSSPSCNQAPISAQKKARLIEWSLAYQILSTYTSFLAVDERTPTAVPVPRVVETVVVPSYGYGAQGRGSTMKRKSRMVYHTSMTSSPPPPPTRAVRYCATRESDDESSFSTVKYCMRSPYSPTSPGSGAEGYQSDTVDYDEEDSSDIPRAPTPKPTLYDLLRRQDFDGHFSAQDNLLCKILDTLLVGNPELSSQWAELKEKKGEVDYEVTLFVLTVLKTLFAAESITWQLMAGKAEQWCSAKMSGK